MAAVFGEPSKASGSISRRDILKRGAVIGGTMAWTVPVVQAISLTPAHAESPSAPGRPQPPEQPPVQPPAQGTPGGEQPAGDAPKGESQAGNAGLAATGAALPVLGTVAVASAAVAAGAAAVAASRRNQDDGEAEPTTEA